MAVGCVGGPEDAARDVGRRNEVFVTRTRGSWEERDHAAGGLVVGERFGDVEELDDAEEEE
eukprot:9522963-Heterocapsa_arctica.AAC.1